jgi:hypothetical protein
MSAITFEAPLALATNNQVRAKHNLKPLLWDNQLADHAAVWAQHLADIGKMQHSANDSRPGEGENLYTGMGRVFTFTDGVNAWLAEVKDYHGEKIGEGDLHKFGHYSKFFCFISTTNQCLHKVRLHARP